MTRAVPGGMCPGVASETMIIVPSARGTHQSAGVESSTAVQPVKGPPTRENVIAPTALTAPTARPEAAPHRVSPRHHTPRMSNGANVEAAQKLADWLTAPEQQIKAFESKGTFPSQVEALSSDEVLSTTNPFFNDAPTGQILANRANAVTVTPFKGANYFAINDAMQQALNRVDVAQTDDADTSWKKFEDAVNALG